MSFFSGTELRKHFFAESLYFSGNPFMFFLLKIALTSDHSLTFRQRENISSFPNEYEFGFSILPPTWKKVAFLFLLLKGFQIRKLQVLLPYFSLAMISLNLVSCCFPDFEKSTILLEFCLLFFLFFWQKRSLFTL